jgi:hypothetical protein
MIGFLVDHTRVGVEDETVVINAVLPAAAVHNLMLAAELSLSSPEGDSREGRPRQNPAKAAWNLDQMLQYRMTLDIPQQSLELAMQELVQQAHDASQQMQGFRIQVIGEDLREAGVTRNQQIRDFRREQQTIAELLTGLVMQANPISTVEHPSDLDQKLVWVAAPDPAAPDERIVLVTTRQAAQREGWPLPAVFQPVVRQDTPRE